jgi:hypothetical protein
MLLSYSRQCAAYAGLRFGEWSSGQRVRLYCVGTAKSGTHSIASMFRGIVRAKHEPNRKELIPKILEIGSGRLRGEPLKEWVRARDRKLRLRVDSANMYLFLFDTFQQEFPKAKFLLTIRDCYSWLNSVMRHALRFPNPAPMWASYREMLYQPHLHSHAPEEQPLKQRGLYPIDAYLSNWAAHNASVLDRIPETKLMVVKTDEIGTKACDVARFAGLPPQLVLSSQAHTFENPVKGNLLQEIPRNFLEGKVEQHCRALMTRFFPEIRSLEDAKV